MTMTPQLTSDAMLLLRSLGERDMDGYTAMARTGLNEERLEKALDELLSFSLVRVSGVVRGPRLGEAYLQAPAGVLRFFPPRFSAA